MAKYRFTFLEAKVSHASQGLTGQAVPPTRMLPAALQIEIEVMMKLQADWEKLCDDLVKLPEFEVEAGDGKNAIEEAYKYLKGKVEQLTVNTGADKVVLNGGSQPTYRPSPLGHWIEDWLQLKKPDSTTVAWELVFPKAKPEYKLYPTLRVLLSPPK